MWVRGTKIPCVTGQQGPHIKQLEASSCTTTKTQPSGSLPAYPGKIKQFLPLFIEPTIDKEGKENSL